MGRSIVKRAFTTIAALLVCGAIGSAARAQTPAQAAKYSRYLSNHPGVAQRLAANPGLGNVSSYMAGNPGAQNYSGAYQTQYMKNLATYNNYMASHPGLAANQGLGSVGSYMAGNPGAQNYSSAYQTQYMKNLATYNNYMATHPGLAASQGLGGVNPYMAGYPGQYPYPTQQLASSPIMGLVAPFMSGNPGLQNYGGGYGGNVAPIYQPSYTGASYPPPAQWGNNGDENRWHHHHHFDGNGYGPYSSGAYGPYASGGYGQYGGVPTSQPWHHHFDRNFGPAGQSNGQRFFGVTPGANRAAWAASHPFASAGHHGWWGHNH
jgi:hypothetical protein